MPDVETTSTVLRVVRQRPNGRRQVHRVIRAGDGILEVMATPWLPPQSDEVTATWAHVDAAATDDLGVLLRRTPALTALRRRQLTLLTLKDGVLEPAVVTSLLRVSVAGGPEDPADWDQDTLERWSEVAVPRLLLPQDATWFARYAAVNDMPIAVLDLSGGTPTASSLQAMLIDESNYELVPLKEIDSYSYSNDWGSAGGWVAELVAERVMLIRFHGDELGKPRLVLWPRNRRGQAQILRYWHKQLDGPEEEEEED